MQSQLIGYWDVVEVKMHEGVVLVVIGGSEGDIVQITDNNRFIVWQEGGIGYKYKYRLREDIGPQAIDIYSVNPRDVNEAIFTIRDGMLTICAASVGYQRPTAFELTTKYHMLRTLRRSRGAKASAFSKV